MKKILLILLSFSCGSSYAQFSLKDLKALNVLNGNWQSERKHGLLIEQWIVVNDSTMHAYSYIKNGKDSIPEEKVELSLRNGKIFYTAAAVNQNDDQPVAFALTAIDAGKYIFENRGHDFPQQITYQLMNDKTLHASISGPMNGKETRVDFHFKRMQ